MINKIKPCLVCGLVTRYRRSPLIINKSLYIDSFSCENRCCQLPPYTMYYAAYVDDKLYYGTIIINIDGIYYLLELRDQPILEPSTGIFIIKPWIEQDYSVGNGQYLQKDICEVKYVLPWHDINSAKEVIMRLLKIKAFS